MNLRTVMTPAAVALVGFVIACSRPATDPSALLPDGETRTIDFETDEGTWMSLDVSPDAQTVVFDLLGQIYRLPVEGGRANALTQNSGIALNFHPAYSPDGTQIAFISDRAGQNNVWVMEADGRNPRPVFLDPDSRFTDPEWMADGRAVVAVRAFSTPGRGWHRQTTELWQLPLDGREPRQLLSGDLAHYRAPSFAPDGRLYYHVAYSTGEGMGLLQAGHRIQRYDFASSRAENVRRDEPAELTDAFRAALRRTGYAADVRGEDPAALNPEVSPDGRLLAFAQEMPGETFEYRGHQFGPRTALFIRNLVTGEERAVLDPAPKDLTKVNAQYAYRAFPGYAWMPDSRSLLIGHAGRIRRVSVDGEGDETVPFTARVHRVISQQTRGRVEIEDDTLTVKFLQWPASSPDGRRLAFTAVGRIWIMDLPRGSPRPLTEDVSPAVQFTPAWSPDGTEVAFASWDDVARGHLWVASPDDSAPRRLTTVPGEYIYPQWSPDGESVLVTSGPGPQRERDWNGWNRVGGWSVVRLPVGRGPSRLIAALAAPSPSSFGPQGRVYFHTQENVEATGLLYRPFPPEDALRQAAVVVRSVSPRGGDERDHLGFPPALTGAGQGNLPMVSPDGRWVAFQASRSVYVAEVPSGPGEAGIPQMTTDPNVEMAGRIRIGSRGGAYHRWRNPTTLEFVSGNQYVTHDAVSGETQSITIDLRVPRHVPRGTLALTGAKIITIEGDAIIERGDVVVTGSRLSCVGTCDTSGADRVIDVSGKVIVPGFIDLHAHHTVESSGVIPPHRPSSALDLAYGITTIVDPATGSESAFPLAEMTEAGVVVGPRTFSAAEFVITRAYAWGDLLAIRGQEDAAYHVNRRADWGAVTIKNYRQPGRREHQLIMRAARDRGISVTSEGGPLYFDIGLAMDGQTGWEHLVAQLPLYRDATTFLGRAGMVYSPTVIVAGHVNGAKEYFRPRQHLLEDEKYRRFMPLPVLRRQVAASTAAIPLTEVSFPIVAEGLADIVRAGGFGAIGEHGEQYGIGSHWEIWAYAAALTPLEALTVASLHGAYFIGFDQEAGSIKEGKLADLIVLNADPLADIHNTQDIALVMKAGRLYDDDTLEEIWPDRKPYGPAGWR